MPMPGDSREDIEAAVAELSGEGSGSGSGPASSPSPAPAAEPSSAEPAARDASGKFAPRVPATNEVLEDKKPGTEEVTDPPTDPNADPTKVITPAPVPPGMRAPVSWRPEEREGWEKLDPRHQQAIIRREREVGEVLRTSVEARQFAGAMQNVLTPYMPMIQAENSNPVQAVQAVMQTAAVLRTAPPAQRAQAVADMIQQFGIDINMLDEALSARQQGRAPAADPMAPILQALDQRLAPMQQFMSTFQQRQAQVREQETQGLQQTTEQFLQDPANEFAMDVIDDMADLLEMATRRGQTLSLQDAYQRATLLHPTISKVIEARKSGQGLAQQTAAAQNARNAAASVTNGGAPSASSGEGEDGDDIRSALGASIRQLSARR
jgi:hypothetical protein